MKIIVDDKIPHIADFFTQCDEMVYVPGEKITRADCQQADALLTRTVTTVDAALLAGTSVRFVGTATTGTDHIDTQWLEKHHVTLATAAGANAQAVAEYVICCLAALKFQGKTAGVIGCGRIGRIVAAISKTLGFTVLCYDPLLTESLDFNFVSLEQLVAESDLISIHTPLTTTGPYPTFHLLNESLLKKIKPNALLINTARGSVIDQTALLKKENILLCLDVWEKEPQISLALLQKATIATPHIAGYSLQAKYRATEMIYESAAKFFGWPIVIAQHHTTSNDALIKILLSSDWVAKSLSIDDLLVRTKLFRDAFSHCKTGDEIKNAFIRARQQYPLRLSFL